MWQRRKVRKTGHWFLIPEAEKDIVSKENCEPL